jgi:flagellar biosynthetic protein FlhB
MAEDSGGEKTLPASGQKIQRAREEGNIARSQDLSSGIALAIALLAVVLFGQGMMETMLAAGRYYIENAPDLVPERQSLRVIAASGLWIVALCVGPVALVMLGTGLLANVLQVGFLMTTKPLVPKLSRINPISGFQKFFSLRSLVELVKSILKLVLVIAVVWFAVRNRLDDVLQLMTMSPAGIVGGVSTLVFAVWWRIAAVMVILGMFDYGYQRWQHLQDLRMTHQEARQESKELEGDPHIKRRVRQLQRQIATQRMMKDVPKADVIITNPVRFAVALRYDMGEMDTPVVVAKGARKVAERIREIAAEHDVPIVQKPELARALYKSIEVGQGIPENLFRAVAEVLSFVYRIDRRQEKIREREAAWAQTGGGR